MKYTPLLLGLIFIVINTLAGLIFNDYATYKILFADFSIIISTGMLYFLHQMKTSDGFKIGFSLFFGLTGLIRFICAVTSISQFKSNFAILIFIIVICLESVLIYVSHAMRNK
jgi:hypothetical protein